VHRLSVLWMVALSAGCSAWKASGPEIESFYVNQGLQLPTPMEGSVAHAHDYVFIGCALMFET
jgi:hypothetical protein